MNLKDNSLSLAVKTHASMGMGEDPPSSDRDAASRHRHPKSGIRTRRLDVS